MKSTIIKWSLPALMTCSAVGLHAQQINPITEAVLQNYAEILAENPKDYLTLYDRASQYYDLGEYARALSDIEMALEYTPETDKTYRQSEYSLQSEILTAMKKYKEAIETSRQALAINPVSQPDLYRIGNLYLLTNDPQSALNSFQALQRENPRSQEAFYGMAKANALMGRTQDAEKMVKEIESLGVQSFITYCRLGDLYSDMGSYKDATTNYAIAYSMEDNNNRPIESLKLVYRKSPDVVMETLDGLIISKPENLSLNFLKAIVAFDGNDYAKAEKACKDLISGLEEESPAVYRMLAMSQLAQNKLTEANANIAAAEKLTPDDAGMLLDKSEILMSQDPQASYAAAEKALKADSDNERALLTAANAAILAEKYPEAQNYLNTVVLNNPGNAEALLLRGYLNTEYNKDGKAGVADYTRAGSVVQNGDVANLVYAAIGKSKVNKKLDAEGMINEAIEKAGKNGGDLYLIAIYYAQTDNLEKAKEYVDKAVINGYGNLYNIQTNNRPLLNLMPIHHLLGGK